MNFSLGIVFYWRSLYTVSQKMAHVQLAKALIHMNGFKKIVLA